MRGTAVNHIYARHTVNLDASAYSTYFRLWRLGELVDGEAVSAFERAFAEYTGAANCVAVSSARAGFYLTLKAFGIGRGDEVIMPAYTFPSMPAAVVATGARPVFVDVDSADFNIAASLAERAVTDRTRAIVVAHLFGCAADMGALGRLAEAKDIHLIEDCAHAAGVRYGSKRVGSFGDAAVFSFGIGKNMPCFGGGAITFQDTDLAGSVRKLVNAAPLPDDFAAHKKVLGSFPSWLLTRPQVFPWTLYIAARVLSSIGSDAMDRSVEEPLSATTKFSLRVLGRMANFQAAVGLQQLSSLPERNAKLAENGRRLAEKLRDIPSIQPPPVKTDEEHIYLYFRVLVPGAERFRTLLLKRGIDTQRDDMRNCAGLEAFKDYAADCPVAASLPERSIELPNNPRLCEADTDYIAESVREVAGIISSIGAGGPG